MPVDKVMAYSLAESEPTSSCIKQGRRRWWSEREVHRGKVKAETCGEQKVEVARHRFVDLEDVGGKAKARVEND